jgi:hypothetical protein
MALEFRRCVDKWNGYFPLAKDMISGFSIHFCPICLIAQFIPIKDLGIDLTCEGRHRCVIMRARSLNLMAENEPAKEGQLIVQMFQELYMWINFWIPGKQLIVAEKITLPYRTDDRTDNPFVIKQYDIPKKYHLEKVDFNRSPWIRTLFDNGKIEPTYAQLHDYCMYCHGTYAILKSHENNSFQYYSVFLARA